MNGILSFIPLIRNHLINKITGFLYTIIIIYYSYYYFKQANICKILFGDNKDEWKEIIVYSSALLILIHIFSLILSITITDRAGTQDANLDLLLSFHIIKTFTFIILSSIYSTVPGTLSAIQNSTITSLRTFIRHLSHEVRTPMNVVQMNLETINEKICTLKSRLSFGDYEELIDITNESVESSEVAVNVLNEILEVDKITQGLEKYEKEKEKLGWYTCVEIINRIAKHEGKKKKGASTAAFNANDERFLGLIAIPTIAMKQGVMNSKAKRGHSTDDLSSLKESMEILNVNDLELYTLVTNKLKEEQDEEDNHEEGDFGFDFEGGSIGF